MKVTQNFPLVLRR